MQDVSCEPRMLWLSGNPSSKLGYFQEAAPSTLQGSCIHRKAINIDKPLVLWRTALQAEYHVGDYPGTPPSSVYQVTHGTAFQAAECHVIHHVL